MKFYTLLIKISLLLLLCLPGSLLAETTQYQILNSNVYCINGSVGPKVFIVTNGNPTETASATLLGQCATKIKSLTKQLKALKVNVKKSPKNKKLKTKQKKFTRDKLFYSDLGNAVLECMSLKPVVTQSTPVPAAPTIFVLPTNVPAPTSIPLPTVPPTPLYLSNAIPPSNYYLYAGAEIYAADNQYLGIFSTNLYSADSIANQYGTYGSPFRTYSVFNKFGQYGSEFSSKSAWNSYSSSPPILIINGQGVAYITTNTFKTPRIDPAEFLAAVGRSS